MSRCLLAPFGAMCVFLCAFTSGAEASARQPTAVIRIIVRSDAGPVPNAQVVVVGRTTQTDAEGRSTLQVPPGPVEITVVKEGYNPVTLSATGTLGPPQEIPIVLERQTAIEEHVTVSATRTDKRFEDQPMRVEVLDAEEIGEKQLMTPGDIVMMLNEMGGLRVQATSPSLGAASVRVQACEDGTRAFCRMGSHCSEPMWAGSACSRFRRPTWARSKSSKGVASALYGAGALVVVVDLISRRPTKEPVREGLVNRTSRGATDATFFAAQPLSERWSGTMLVGGHWQQRNDVDDDGWADLSGYSRAVVRPRVFWSNDAGGSLFATGGAMWESRRGGTMPSAVLTPTGAPYPESLDTMRLDGGLVAQTPIADRYVLTARASATGKDEQYQRGDVLEHDVQHTVFVEAFLSGTAPRQTWVGGLAFERSTLDARDEPNFSYEYNVRTTLEGLTQFRRGWRSARP